MTAAFLTAEGAVELRDGRRLAYSAAGARRGFPVLYFHGAIGSPLRRSPLLDAAIESFGIRYLMVHRPGFGGSDPLPGRRVACFASDIEELADQLGLERFSIVGVSAGGPYAIACARAMPDRIVAAAAVSSTPPGFAPHATRGMGLRYRLGLATLLGAPVTATRLATSALRVLRRRPGLVAGLMTAGASDADEAVLADPEARETAVRTFLAAAERGVAQMVEDYLVCCRPWGFEPSEVGGRVHIWHGALDRLVPITYALRLANALPNRAVALDPGEGHFFFRRRLPEIIGPLAGAEERPPEPLELAA
jgi:pimeloyl-ACP methyl ester carboxylesterase